MQKRVICTSIVVALLAVGSIYSLSREKNYEHNQENINQNETSNENEPSKESEVIDEVQKQIDEINGLAQEQKLLEQQAFFNAIELKEGSTLIGKQGCEIILRSGIAKAIVPGENGLSDITFGKDIINNDTLKEDHLLVIPADDGRGLKAETDIWILVKGDYEIIN